MKCEICGKAFSNLGIHTRVSHDVDPKSYYDTYKTVKKYVWEESDATTKQ